MDKLKTWNRIICISYEINTTNFIVFTVDESNGVHDFMLFKCLKDVSILISYIP